MAQDVTIYQIQFTEDPSGDSPLEDSTVFTGGIVTGVDFTGQPIRYFIADRVGGLWSGVLVNDNQDRQLSVGDSVRFQAEVQESSGQTRLRNIVGGTFSTVPQSGSVPPALVATGAVGEAAEGVLIEFTDAIVTAINADNFIVNDGTGPATIGEGWSYSYSPLIGDTLRYLRGIISASSNVYTVNPRSDADFGFFGNRPPLISDVHNSPESPTELQADSIFATIVDEDGVQSAGIFYRFGESGDFAEQTMYDDGFHGDGNAGDGVWGGVLPAGPARTTAYYYVCATDNEAATGCSPADAPDNTYTYVIRSSSLSIFDLQYTGNPTGGTSPYLDSIVTVTGIVTGTNFGDSFYMSDPGGGLWSGIYVFGPTLTPALGDCVRVTGQIIEYQDAVTEFASGAEVELLGGGYDPLPLDSLDGVRAGVMGDSAEVFEGCLVKLGVCWVTSTADWNGGFPVFEVGDATGRAIIAGDASFEYEPVIGDSFKSITGCVDYFSANGWEIAPRFDADFAYIDHRVPQLVSAETVSPYEVNLLFNEPLLDSLINDPDNYTVIDQSDPEFPMAAVDTAFLFSNGRTIHITFFDPLDPEHAYRLTVGEVWDASPNRNVLANAVINFGGYEPGEFTPIATLYDSFDVYNGRTVALRGIVNFVQDVTTTSGSRRISAYMQDESGKGFSLSQSGAAATFPAIQRGNWIRITGVVNQFDGVIQLGSFSGTDAVVLSENVPLPAPIVINTGDYRTQRRIVRTSDPDLWGAGTWVKSSGTIYRVDENVGGGTNIFIDDGTGNLTIRIWDSMQLDSVELNGEWYLLRELVGRTVSVAGPSSTFGGDFQMLAGYAEDFTVETISGEPSASPVLEVPARAFAPDRGQTLRIDYNAPALSQVRIRIFDLRGRLVKTLVDKPAGGPSIYVWNGRNDLNELVPMGTYILHLESVQNGKSEEQTKPIVVGTKL